LGELKQFNINYSMITYHDKRPRKAYRGDSCLWVETGRHSFIVILNNIIRKVEMKKIGMLTVGQSPRVDIIPNMKQIIGDQVTLIERGALDNLSKEEICSLAPEKGVPAIISRLADGSSVVVAKKKLIDKVQLKINEFSEEGVELIVILCTGPLPGLKSNCLLVEAEKVVFQWVSALLHGQGTLGVLTPLPEQKNEICDAFSDVATRTVVASADPYGPISEVVQAGETFSKNGVDLILMDCMGYRNEHRSALKTICHKPILLSHAMVARTIAEITQI
jgi:protein AroM